MADREKALEWLERAYAERDASVTYLKVAPEFDALHSDPRFQAPVRRLGLQPEGRLGRNHEIVGSSKRPA